MNQERSKVGWLGILMAVSLFFASCGSGEDFNSSVSNGSGGGTGISNMFSSPAEMGVGDLMPIEFDGSEEITIDFRDVVSGANFILSLGSSNYNGYGTSIQVGSASQSLPEVQNSLTSGMMVEEVAPDEVYGAQEMMSAWLRLSESDLHSYEDVIDDPNSTVGAKALGFKAPEMLKVLGCSRVCHRRLHMSMSMRVPDVSATMSSSTSTQGFQRAFSRIATSRSSVIISMRWLRGNFHS